MSYKNVIYIFICPREIKIDIKKQAACERSIRKKVLLITSSREKCYKPCVIFYVLQLVTASFYVSTQIAIGYLHQSVDT